MDISVKYSSVFYSKIIFNNGLISMYSLVIQLLKLLVLDFCSNETGRKCHDNSMKN